MCQTKALGDNVSDHKFKVGQTVYYTSGRSYGSSRSGSVFKIMQLSRKMATQYRLKSADERHDRVVKESELDRAM